MSARTDTPPAGLLGFVDRFLSAVAGCFHSTRPAAAPRPRWELPVLLAILAVAAFIRFWGVGSWGLENDEETMAMPTMHILQDGKPILPSGMFYARGISQLYMMAGAVKVFGHSEWALRFPSVICGILFIAIVWLYGRRFLNPIANMTLVAVAAFLPAYVADSQEARMYIFMSTCLAGYGVLLFEWERTGRMAFLAAAVAVMLAGLQFHVLTIFGAFLVFYPGLLQGNLRKILQGGAAFAVIVAGYFLISGWVSSFYPPRPASHGIEVVLDERTGGLEWTNLPLLWVAVAAVIALGVVAFSVHRVADRKIAVTAGVALFAGLLAQLCFFNHVGLLLLLIGVVLLVRQARASLSTLVPVLLLSALILVVHFVLLHHAGVGSSRKVLGAMVGLPSVWPFLRMAQFSPMSLLLSVAGLVVALYRFARGERLPDYWLFFALGAWIPMLMLGVFSWDVAPRYTEFALLPVFVVAIAPLMSMRAVRLPAVLGAAALAIVIVNPIALAKVVNAGYTIHPDHKGAAEFIQAQRLGPADVVLAEDVNQQAYYLGHVDYWLIGESIGETFSRPLNGELRDIYTNTKVMTTGDELLNLLNRPDRGAVYVIGSGEQQEDGRRHARGESISAVMQRPEFKVVYHGRDGLTKVWKVDAPTGAVQTPAAAH